MSLRDVLDEYARQNEWCNRFEQKHTFDCWHSMQKTHQQTSLFSQSSQVLFNIKPLTPIHMVIIRLAVLKILDFKLITWIVWDFFFFSFFLPALLAFHIYCFPCRDFLPSIWDFFFLSFDIKSWKFTFAPRFSTFCPMNFALSWHFPTLYCCACSQLIYLTFTPNLWISGKFSM